MSQTVTVLCSNDSCIHNSGGSYYGVCNHPNNQDRRFPYAGIDRYYQSSCVLEDRGERSSQDDTQRVEEEVSQDWL